MRKAQKKQAEDFVELLGQSHEEIENSIKEKRNKMALGLLEQCQDGAIQLSIMIGKLEGENIATIPLLKQYSEIVYGIYERIFQGEAVDLDLIHVELGNLLSQIKDSVKKDIKVCLEAVFLPYKASMWDSLESVWNAADKNVDCNTYVIPIPYYDKNADGSLGEEHYEGDLYPDYVPITRYDVYNFKERRPDMIFIHNSYDECNYVTSVHPFFYSNNLKQYTERLVYIPYFILNEINPMDKAAIDGMRHFCTLPGIYNADKIIVQSEDMRKIYINVLTEASGGTKKIRKYWEYKIEGIGSPKFDKLLGTLIEEDICVPENWLKLIRKKDGRNKKLILYNTSVTALLQHGEKMLQKIETVFKIFYEYQDEVTLLWRPHPLFEATLSSMRPQLWEKYQKLVGWYKDQGWGIYDDSADLDRAIAMSDAYYGDGSSLVQLFEKAGKPIMIQNVERFSNEQYRRLRFIDFLDDGDSIWFCALYTNGLFRFDKSTGKTEIVCFLPTETLHESYRSLCMKDRKIYLAPIYAENIAIYDLNEQKLEQLPLLLDFNENQRMPSKGTANFSNMHVWGKYIFLVPLSFGAIIRLDTETNKIDYFNDFVGLLLPVLHNHDAYWFSSSCVIGDKIYMPTSGANALIEFDMKSCVSILHKLGTAAVSYSMICHDESHFWIMGYNGDSIIVWDKQDGVIDKVKLNYKGKYNCIFSLDDAVFRIPLCENLSCDQISKSNCQSVSTVKLQIIEIDKWSVSSFFKDNDVAFGAKKQDEKIFVYSTQRDSLCVFDKKGKYLQEWVFELYDNDFKRYLKVQSKRLGAFAERNNGNITISEDYFVVNLPYFLNYLFERDRVSGVRKQRSEDYGRNIFENVKKEVFNG